MAMTTAMPSASGENLCELPEARLEMALIERIFSVAEDGRKRSDNSKPAASRFPEVLASCTLRLVSQEHSTGPVIRQVGYRLWVIDIPGDLCPFSAALADHCYPVGTALPGAPVRMLSLTFFYGFPAAAFAIHEMVKLSSFRI
jgi:hypothetical protein